MLRNHYSAGASQQKARPSRTAACMETPAVGEPTSQDRQPPYATRYNGARPDTTFGYLSPAQAVTGKQQEQEGPERRSGSSSQLEECQPTVMNIPSDNAQPAGASLGLRQCTARTPTNEKPTAARRSTLFGSCLQDPLCRSAVRARLPGSGLHMVSGCAIRTMESD